jgi:hypothetical protein
VQELPPASTEPLNVPQQPQLQNTIETAPSPEQPQEPANGV